MTTYRTVEKCPTCWATGDENYHPDLACPDCTEGFIVPPTIEVCRHCGQPVRCADPMMSGKCGRWTHDYPASRMSICVIDGKAGPTQVDPVTLHATGNPIHPDGVGLWESGADQPVILDGDFDPGAYVVAYEPKPT